MFSKRTGATRICAINLGHDAAALRVSRACSARGRWRRWTNRRTRLRLYACVAGRGDWLRVKNERDWHNLIGAGGEKSLLSLLRNEAGRGDANRIDAGRQEALIETTLQISPPPDAYARRLICDLNECADYTCLRLTVCDCALKRAGHSVLR